MGKSSDSDKFRIRRARILLDPLSYMHPHRLKLPRCFDTPRHRSVFNQIVLSNVPCAKGEAEQESYAQRQLEKYWSYFPFICSLVGAQLLKSDLARRGRSLRLSESIRIFMGLSLQHIIAAEEWASEKFSRGNDFLSIAEKIGFDPFLEIQGAGLSCVLNWQRQSSMLLLSRFRLLFPPELDPYFDFPRRQAHAGELFLISQAIQYAKNHTDHG